VDKKSKYMKIKKSKDNAGVLTAKIKWCDLSCEFADFPDNDAIDGANSCRTFIGLYCKKLKSIVPKNSPCSLKFGKRRPKANW